MVILRRIPPELGSGGGSRRWHAPQPSDEGRVAVDGYGYMDVDKSMDIWICESIKHTSMDLCTYLKSMAVERVFFCIS
jgi:hypothetical protein